MTQGGGGEEEGGGGNVSTTWPEVVISGISGRFPESANLKEFQDNLFSGTDMVTESGRRWTPGLHGLPTRLGQLKELDKFDASFFGVHGKQAEVMDPQLRILLEVTYEAILDSGFNPAELRGTNTGVFIGCSNLESLDVFCMDPKAIDGYGLLGGTHSMMANRVSYTFDLKGVSFPIDTACSSSLLAIHQAVQAIRTGHCDAAIVAGVALCMKPAISQHFNKLSMLSPEGKCKSFDASGNGYVRSEAVVAILIQKKDLCRRNYCTILHTNSNNDGFKEVGITMPSGIMQQQLLEKVYQQARVDPNHVTYVECHGTGTKAGDPQELGAVTQVFCKNRTPLNPLLVGSVKSNMGHPEPAAGLCSIAKVLLAIKNGSIPANLHFKSPNTDIPALVDGRIRVVTQNTKWNRGLVGVSGFGWGGANVHVILKPNPAIQPTASLSPDLPIIVPFSARTRDAVQHALDDLVTKPRDDELFALLQRIHRQPINGHPHRGFAIIDDFNSEGHTQQLQQNQPKSPLWFVFSGMGSQWSGMGRDLMKFKIFQNSINKSAALLLKTHGLNLMDLLLETNERPDSPEQNVLSAFVSIASVQVGLVDLLTSMGITPDGIVGHSVGELACSYADNCLTAEQTVLAAYARGKALLDAKLEEGAMAAVGLGWEEAKRRCPPGVFPACHNSADSVTIAGPPKKLDELVEKLKSEGIFAQKVNSCGQAFHSPMVAAAGPKFRKYLEEILPKSGGQPRSLKWVSSSVPESRLEEPSAKFCGVDYHVNNMLSPVLFKGAVAQIPPNSIVLEIAPHCILQAILKRSLPVTCVNVGLLRRQSPDVARHLLTSIGNLFNAGLNPDIGALYENVQFPVSLKADHISPLVQWDHGVSWTVAKFKEDNSDSGKEAVVELSLKDSENDFYTGHVIDGRILFPGSGYLLLVWKVFATLKNTPHHDLPVTFERFAIHSAVTLDKHRPVKFHVNIFDISGEFQVQVGRSMVCSGVIRLADDVAIATTETPVNSGYPDSSINGGNFKLKSRDIYKELGIRGYEYSNVEFQGMAESDVNCNKGKIIWRNNWVTLVDAIFQFHILSFEHRALYLPSRIQQVTLNPTAMGRLAAFEVEAGGQQIDVYSSRHLKIHKCAGVHMQGFESRLASQVPLANTPVVESYEFSPYHQSKNSQNFRKDDDSILRFCMAIVSQNYHGSRLKIAEIIENVEQSLVPSIAPILKQQPQRSKCDISILPPLTMSSEEYPFVELLEDLPANYSNVKILTRSESQVKLKKEKWDWDLVILDDLAVVQNSAQFFEPGAFALVHSRKDQIDTQFLQNGDFSLVASRLSEDGQNYFLLRRNQLKQNDRFNLTLIPIKSGEEERWIDELKIAMNDASVESLNDQSLFRIILVAQAECDSGILGMVNCLKLEPGGDRIRCYFSPQDSPLNFAQPDVQLTKQLCQDLLMNVLVDDQWGTFSHFPLEEPRSSEGSNFALVKNLVHGNMSSLRWVESPLKFYEESGGQSGEGIFWKNSELCAVHYATLNFRDVMLAKGRIPLDSIPGDVGRRGSPLGMEFSGKDKTGRRVMGVVVCRGLATHVEADKDFIWEVPPKWTLSEAATIPMAYATSYYALIVRGHMRPGESVLIHSGSGGVGQAAIRIALDMGCEVFATVGSMEKREYLKNVFPQLKPDNIGDSHATTFEQLVLGRTNGRGVDLVLNSLAGDKLQASVRCLANRGRFLEIGKRDLLDNGMLGMSVFMKNISFHGILLDELALVDTEDKKEVVRLLAQGIESGCVVPLPKFVFPRDQVVEAFRYLSDAMPMGKVMVEVKPENESNSDMAINPTHSILPMTYFDPLKVHIIIGGLGGFGLQLAFFLVERGARNLVLVSRSGVTTGYQQFCIKKLTQEEGARVSTVTDDVTSVEGATRLLTKVTNDDGPVGSIFNLAMVLRDALMENQTADAFEAVSRPKIQATLVLDEVSRSLCPELDHFVVFSSVVSGHGNLGQSNYAFANSSMERICERRQRDGLPGLAVQWGAIGDVGVLHETMGGGGGSGKQKEIIIGGTTPQRINSCLAILDTFLCQRDKAVVSSFTLPVSKNKKKETSDDESVGGISAGDESVKSTALEAVARIMGIKDTIKLDDGVMFQDIGMDSLMSGEIKQLLELEYDLPLSMVQIQKLTIGKLKELDVNSGGGGVGRGGSDRKSQKINDRSSSKDDRRASPDRDRDSAIASSSGGSSPRSQKKKTMKVSKIFKKFLMRGSTKKA